MEVGEEGDYISVGTLAGGSGDHQNDCCIKMGSDESQFNVSLIVRDKVTRQCPHTSTLEVKGEPKQIRTRAPLLTTISHNMSQLF